MSRPYRVVDVFTTTPYSGNPVAVVLDADELDAATMQRFAAWTNLSETTFVVPPSEAGADYRVRIFTPSAELPFAGHPTLGTCAAWLDAGGVPAGDDVVQECGAGLVRVRRTADGLAFEAPPLLRSGPVDDELVDRLATILGVERAAVVDAQWADNGPGWVAVLLASADAVLALRPRDVGDLDVGVVGPHSPGSDAAWEVRAFSSGPAGMVEDPVTGSLNASVAQWLLASGRASAPYVARQGTALGREGRVHVTQDSHGTVRVGGGTVLCVAGEVEL